MMENPYQAPEKRTAEDCGLVSIERDEGLAYYCGFVGLTLLIVSLLLIWPIFFNILMATDGFPSIVRSAPRIVFFLIALVCAVALLALVYAALVTFKIGRYIRQGTHPDFVLRVARFHLIYFPLGTMLYFRVRAARRVARGSEASEGS